jgi:hypothetical protein
VVNTPAIFVLSIYLCIFVLGQRMKSDLELKRLKNSSFAALRKSFSLIVGVNDNDKWYSSDEEQDNTHADVDSSQASAVQPVKTC